VAKTVEGYFPLPCVALTDAAASFAPFEFAVETVACYYHYTEGPSQSKQYRSITTTTTTAATTTTAVAITTTTKAENAAATTTTKPTTS
jgi:hypothetical protein